MLELNPIEDGEKKQRKMKNLVKESSEDGRKYICKCNKMNQDEPLKRQPCSSSNVKS